MPRLLCYLCSVHAPQGTRCPPVFTTMNPNFWFHIFVLGLGAPIVFALTKNQRHPNPLLVAAAVLVTLLGVWGYSNFSVGHGRGPGAHYHYSEFWQYYLGSKYYKEVSNTRIYDAAATALSDNALPPPAREPQISGVRDLTSPFRILTTAEAISRFRETGIKHFSPERWESFKKDIRLLYDSSGGRHMLLLDMGYNPPPTYGLMVGAVSNLLPINAVTLQLVATFDWVILIVAAWLLLRTFGAGPAFAFLLVFLTNPLSNWGWVGGAYFRNIEVFGLVAGVCMLSERRFALAGVAMSLAAAARLFPAVFALAAAFPMLDAWRRSRTPENESRLLRFATGFLAALAVLFLASLVEFGWQNWADFFRKIWLHSKILFTYHIGFDKLPMRIWENTSQYFDVMNRDGVLLPFQNWLLYNTGRYNEHWVLYGLAKLAIWSFAALLCLRARPRTSALFLGELTLFLFALPANYYYMTVAVLVAVTAADAKDAGDATARARLWVSILALMCMNLADGFWRDPLLVNSAHNWVILAWLCMYAVLIWMSQVSDGRFRLRPLSPVWTMGVFAVAILALQPRTFPSTNVDLPETVFADYRCWSSPKENTRVQKLSERLSPWSGKTQILVTATEPLLISATLNIPMDGVYRIGLDYTKAPDYVNSIRLSAASQSYEIPTNTPGVEPSQWESPPLSLPAGPLRVEVSAHPEPERNLVGLANLFAVPVPNPASAPQ